MLAASAQASARARSASDEHILRDIGRPACEPGDAIREIESPATDEFLVEALRAHRVGVGIKCFEPAAERLRVVSAESVRARNIESCLRGVGDEA